MAIEFWIEEERISASASVRTRDPGVGMGIEFIGLKDDGKHLLQAHLDTLDPGMIAQKQKSSD